ncbi:MAG: hypothetical protein ACK5R0_01235 [Bacteroidota bacterium]
MKKKWLIIVSSILVLIALAVRAFFVQANVIEEERKWFVGQLKYDFALKVDSICIYGYTGEGFLDCTLSAGEVEVSIQKELLKKIKLHKAMWFIQRAKNGSYLITNSKASRFQKGDSLLINSNNTRIQVFRKGKVLFQEKISDSMMTALF